MPGTLRWAVAQSRHAGGGQIRFDPTLSGATIILAAPLSLASDTDLDGGCLGIKLTAEPEIQLLRIRDARNVTVRHLTFEKTSYDPESKTARDAITVSGRFSGIWIDSNRFSRCGDGCVDITRVADGRATVSRNLFHDHNKTMLLGNVPCAAGETGEDTVPCSTRQATDTVPPRIRLRLTLKENLFWRASQRNPKAIGGTFVHAIDNLVAFKASTYHGGRKGAAYGMLATDGGQLLAERNVIVGLDARPTSRGIAGEIGDEDAGTRGFVKAVNNIAVAGEGITERLPEMVEKDAGTPARAAEGLSSAQDKARWMVRRLRGARS